jgi:hypothetical protein
MVMSTPKMISLILKEESSVNSSKLVIENHIALIQAILILVKAWRYFGATFPENRQKKTKTDDSKQSLNVKLTASNH